jgi:VanZ family protein
VLEYRKWVLSWLPVLAWMAIIFAASSDTLSFQHSSRFLAPFLRWLVPGITELSIYHVIIAIRKMAHATEYALLFLLLYHALRVSLHPAELTWRWPLAIATLTIVIAYAASDELHQTFVRTREGSIRDVLIDSTGAVFALLFLWAFRRWRRVP